MNKQSVGQNSKKRAQEILLLAAKDTLRAERIFNSLSFPQKMLSSWVGVRLEERLNLSILILWLLVHLQPAMFTWS